MRRTAALTAATALAVLGLIGGCGEEQQQQQGTLIGQPGPAATRTVMKNVTPASCLAALDDYAESRRITVDFANVTSEFPKLVWQASLGHQVGPRMKAITASIERLAVRANAIDPQHVADCRASR